MCLTRRTTESPASRARYFQRSLIGVSSPIFAIEELRKTARCFQRRDITGRSNTSNRLPPIARPLRIELPSAGALRLPPTAITTLTLRAAAIIRRRIALNRPCARRTITHRHDRTWISSRPGSTGEGRRRYRSAPANAPPGATVTRRRCRRAQVGLPTGDGLPLLSAERRLPDEPNDGTSALPHADHLQSQADSADAGGTLVVPSSS